VRSLMNGMKEKDMWKRVFNETYAKQFWTDIRRWFTLCRPTSTDSTSPIQIGRDLELKRPQTVNRNKVRKSHKKPCWWHTFKYQSFFQAFLNRYSTLIHSLSTNIDGFDFNNTVIPI
jgi:hypothetical protein